jgi:hypothetical protein
MYRIRFGVAPAALAAVLSLTGLHVFGAEPEGATDDLKDSTCKEVMRLSGDEREIAIALAHGYVLGKKGTTRYQVEVLANITDQFIDYCLDHPTENALASFEKLAM